MAKLRQAISNIVHNAAKFTKAGTVTLSGRVDAEWLEVKVRDNGTGMPAEILDKIYEPFFTTKPVGMGTGQGLAIARSAIVDKHAGTIDVRSQLGVGTTFTIGLPVT